jgi:hypothetical protein
VADARDALDAELALELLEGELAAELPAHMRAFARAHADGRATPAAPLVARLASTLATARTARGYDALAERGLALLRLVVPLVIEDDPAVAAARAQPPSWAGLAELTAARDAVARTRFGYGAIELLHRLHGVADVGPPVAPPPAAAETTAEGRAHVPRNDGTASERRLDDTQDDAMLSELAEHGSIEVREIDDPTNTQKTVLSPVEAWNAHGHALDQRAIADVWQAISSRFGIAGSVRIDRTSRATSRTFVVVPRVEVVVVVPAEVDTPAARFAVLHELGHAAAALLLAPGVPRVLDEAVASYIARLAEPPSWLPARWATELAVGARRRRGAIAALLDDIERALPEVPDPPPAARPPPALWHDPGAQAAYVGAETIADRLRAQLGANPPRGQLARALVAERDRIDRRARV